ncbi:MAG: hypothetical protein M1429_02470 [Patescibacteria group bacterium]|nr:hypothetical protein [Patescibacteria group bacterium]
MFCALDQVVAIKLLMSTIVLDGEWMLLFGSIYGFINPELAVMWTLRLMEIPVKSILIGDVAIG